jgi:putative transcriptional regulator
MTQHHPDENLLAEYAAGTLPSAEAIAISAHLHFCTKCHRSIAQLEQLAGAMLEHLTPQALPENSYEQLMAAIDNTKHPIIVKPKAYDILPHVVKTMVNGRDLKWRKVTPALKTATLTTGQKEYEVSLQNIKAGGIVPEHDHRGLEMTVVLKGSFSDKNGIYQAGDFLLKQAGDIHQPISACNEDCLCLSVQNGPVKLTGFFNRLLNPFIRLHSA